MAAVGQRDVPPVSALFSEKASVVGAPKAMFGTRTPAISAATIYRSAR